MRVSAAGWGIERRVAEPRAPGVMPAATATALPPEDPPGARDGSHGFFAGPKALFSFDEPIASSSMLHLPGRIASAARSRSTTVAS